MFIVHSDSVFHVDPNTTPDYKRDNSLLDVMDWVEQVDLCAEREHYLMDDTQYLFPIRFLELYGPSGADNNILDATQQDNKTDFQKQNVRRLQGSDTQLSRGWATTGDWTGPFLHISYNGGPGSTLAVTAKNNLTQNLKLSIKVNGTPASDLIVMPFNPETNRYEVEIWGYAGTDLRGKLGDKGAAAMDRGGLVTRTDIIQGSYSDFNRAALDGQYVADVVPNHTMHPVLPLKIEIAVADETETFWDSQGGANYHYLFSMIMRGWEHYLGVGISPNPHGGIGFLEYRNLMSNYGRYTDRPELGRHLEAWEFNAFGQKSPGGSDENFFTVEYMDLHLLNPNCGIGLHRHRDNQEVFLMMEGRAFMVVGDWCQMPDRERALEVRLLTSGHFAMLKGGQLHGLMNPTDANIYLFMFGGYD